MKKDFQIHEYFNSKTFIRPKYRCLYVSFWREDLRWSPGISQGYGKFLAEKAQKWLTDEVCRSYELNSFKTYKGVNVSWASTKERTFLFRQPNENYFEMASLQEKVADFGNHIDFLKSHEFEQILIEIGKKAILAYKG